MPRFMWWPSDPTTTHPRESPSRRVRALRPQALPLQLDAGPRPAWTETPWT